MIFYDFMCMTEGCEKKEKRESRAFPTERDKEKYPPVCPACRKLMEEVDPVEVERKPLPPLVKGSSTPRRGTGFAKGLSSNDPSQLKEDLRKGDIFD